MLHSVRRQLRRQPEGARLRLGSGARRRASSASTIDAQRRRGRLENWPIERLARIDATVIRIAVYELHRTACRIGIAIDEAVEIARRFGTTESAAFVNGVLDAVAKRLGLAAGRSQRHRSGGLQPATAGMIALGVAG